MAAGRSGLWSAEDLWSVSDLADILSMAAWTNTRVQFFTDQFVLACGCMSGKFVVESNRRSSLLELASTLEQEDMGVFWLTSPSLSTSSPSPTRAPPTNYFRLLSEASLWSCNMQLRKMEINVLLTPRGCNAMVDIWIFIKWFSLLICYMLYAIIIIHFLYTYILAWNGNAISQTNISVFLAVFVVNLKCSTLLICQNAQRFTLFYYQTRFIRHLKYYFSQFSVNAEVWCVEK